MNDKTPVRRSHLDYSVRIPARRGQAMIDQTQWCSAQFGPRWEAIGGQTGTWCVFWAGPNDPGHYTWRFAHEQDLVLFLLKYGNDSN